MKSKKALALILAASMLLSLTGCGTAAAALSAQTSEESEEETSLEDTAISLLTSGGHSDEAGKEETVYVVADANGNPQKTIVENWVKNADGSDQLTDKTNLTDIENTKGDEDYTQNADGTITWNAGGSDIYYQGNTDQDLPVDVHVSYQLDGKEVTASELAGASGHLVITFSYTNNTARQTVVDGKTCTIYQPYVMVSGLLLDNDNASNVTVTNGKTVNDGDRTIVVGLAMPGLSESLGLDDVADGEIDIPEEVTVEADVTDFSLLTTLTLASGDALKELGLDEVTDVSDLEDKINELTDGSTKLVDGTAEFSDYMGQLDDATSQLSDGANSVDTYMNTLSDGLSQLQSAVTNLPDGAEKLLAGTEALSKALKSGYDGSDTSKYGVYEAVSAIADGASAISSAAGSIMTGASTVSSAASQIAAGAKSDDMSSAKTYGIYEAAAAVKAGLNAAVQQLTTSLSSANDALTQANTYDQTAMDTLSALIQAGGLTEGQQQAISGAMQAIGGSQQYVAGVQQALGNSSLDLSTAISALDSIQSGAETIQSAASQIAAGVKSGDTSSSDKYGIYEAAAAIKAGADSLNSAAQTVMSGINTMTNSDNLGAIISGLESLNSQSGTLVSAVDTLSNGASSLSDGTGTLASGMTEADEAVQQLYSSSIELKDGMAQLDSEGIQQIADLVTGDLETVFHRLQAVQDYANEQTSFAGCADGVECTVKFIYKTEQIKAD
jgi:putative membrane protein